VGEREIEVATWAAQFADDQRAWGQVELVEQALEQQLLDRWGCRFGEWRADAAALRAAGQWYSGPTDFMGVLWLGQDEVRNCRVLAWLMDPAGAHGLGDVVLRGVSAAAPLDVLAGSTNERVTVLTEQVLGGTRADIVVRTNAGTLVIEAKVNAPESEDQKARYQELWGESATFLFLSRDAGLPSDNVPARNGSSPSESGSKRWGRLCWFEVAEILDEALEVGNPNAPGRGVAEGFRDAIRNHLRPRSDSGPSEQQKQIELGGEFGGE
jgi:hypothetical protein